MQSAVPSSLRIAYQFLAADRAWVVCVPCEGCEESVSRHVHTLASKATCRDLMCMPGVWQFLDGRCPDSDRVSFLLGGINTMLTETFGAAG